MPELALQVEVVVNVLFGIVCACWLIEIVEGYVKRFRHAGVAQMESGRPVSGCAETQALPPAPVAAE